MLPFGCDEEQTSVESGAQVLGQRTAVAVPEDRPYDVPTRLSAHSVALPLGDFYRPNTQNKSRKSNYRSKTRNHTEAPMEEIHLFPGAQASCTSSPLRIHILESAQWLPGSIRIVAQLDQ